MERVLTHTPVMLSEVLTHTLPSLSAVKAPRLLYDGTLGGAGHSKAFLERDDALYLLAVDRDDWALQRARAELSAYRARICFLHSCFSDLQANVDVFCEQFPELCGQHPPLFDVMFVDLGVSSFQLDDAERGFSFRHEAALDMRMDRSQELDAAKVVNEYEPQQLKRVLQRGGLAAQSAQVARAIVNRRPILTTAALAELCEAVLRNPKVERSRHPATLVFQAIRIEVNDELGEIERFLDAVPKHLAPGGRLAVLSFHSSEDKLVASRMRHWARPQTPLRELPQADIPALGRLLTASAILPGEEEIAKNPRARSARLRVFEKSTAEIA